MSTEVINIHHGKVPEDHVYIGRGKGSIYGNPFSHLDSTIAEFKVDTREIAVEAYSRWVYTQPKIMGQLRNLSGKTLACYCHPAPCHGHVLAKMADSIGTTCCFTGHRPKDLYPQDIPKIRQDIREAILRAINDGYTNFVHGGALGVDIWAAEEVLKLKKDYDITSVMHVPCVNQENLWKDEDKLRYYNNQFWCDDVIYSNTGEYAPWKMMARNKTMIDMSNRIIAVWSGKEGGGTHNAWNYASKVCIEIDRIVCRTTERP